MTQPRSKTNFGKVCRSALEGSEIAPYVKGEITEFPVKRSNTADVIANALFYFADYTKAAEASYVYSLKREQDSELMEEPRQKLRPLFLSALYRSLSKRTVEANALWERLIEIRRGIAEHILLRRNANVFVYESYALLKLGRYSEVAEPAQKGYEGLMQGKGIDPIPEGNLELGLPKVFTTLASYQLDSGLFTREDVQKTLEDYKQHNFLHGKGGYRVIFDLQFSYPDVFTPVLPGPDPEQD